MSTFKRTYILILASVTFFLAAPKDASLGITARKFSDAQTLQSHKPKLQGWDVCTYNGFYGEKYCYYSNDMPNEVKGMIVIMCVILLIALIICCVKASRRRRRNALIRDLHL